MDEYAVQPEQFPIASLAKPLAEELKSSGELLEIPSNKPMSLSETQGLLVLEGALELYFIPSSSRQYAGSLFYACTLNPGEFFIPLPAEGMNEADFVVKAQPRTSALRLPSEYTVSDDSSGVKWREFISRLELIIALKQEDLINHVKATRTTSANIFKRGIVALKAVPFNTNTAFLKDLAKTNLVRPKSCLVAAVAHSIGLSVPKTEVPDSFSIEDAMDSAGLQYRVVELGENWWRKSGNAPYLAEYRNDDGTVSSVALLPDAFGMGYSIYSGESFSARRATREEASRVKRMAYRVYRPFTDEKATLEGILKFAMFGHKSGITAVMLIGILGGMLGMLIPELTGKIFSTLIPQAQYSQLTIFFGIMAAIALATGLFQATQQLLLLRAESEIDNDVEAALWDRLLKLRVNFFREYSSGEINGRICALSSVWQVARPAFNTILTTSIFGIFYLGQMIWYDWALALIAVISLAVLALVIVVMGFRLLKCQRLVLNNINNLSSKLVQFISGLGKLRVAGAEEQVFSIWAGDFATQRDNTAKMQFSQLVVTLATRVLPTVIAGVLFYYLVYYGMYDGSTLVVYETGEFMRFWSAYTLLLSVVVRFSSSLIAILSSLPAIANILPIFNAPREISYPRSYSAALSGNIDIKGLRFRYSDKAPFVINGIDLHIESGEYVAIVGSSGSGKSTLLRLLLGFEKPTEGSIFYDGKTFSDIDARRIRSQIGVVLQNAGLFAGDILSNILCGRSLSIEDAWRAAEMAGLKDDILAMPMGMNTAVGEGSGTLSGGQRQRLIIARAIVNNPKILFFDEATSALDNRTQALVTESIRKNKATRIVIAQRLSTIRSADRIILLDRGVVAEEGPYDELIAKEGLFYRLCRRQLF